MDKEKMTATIDNLIKIANLLDKRVDLRHIIEIANFSNEEIDYIVKVLEVANFSVEELNFIKEIVEKRSN
jgi:hypothetical protein